MQEDNDNKSGNQECEEVNIKCRDASYTLLPGEKHEELVKKSYQIYSETREIFGKLYMYHGLDTNIESGLREIEKGFIDIRKGLDALHKGERNQPSLSNFSKKETQEEIEKRFSHFVDVLIDKKVTSYYIAATCERNLDYAPYEEYKECLLVDTLVDPLILNRDILGKFKAGYKGRTTALFEWFLSRVSKDEPRHEDYPKD